MGFLVNPFTSSIVKFCREVIAAHTLKPLPSPFVSLTSGQRRQPAHQSPHPPLLSPMNQPRRKTYLLFSLSLSTANHRKNSPTPATTISAAATTLSLFPLVVAFPHPNITRSSSSFTSGQNPPENNPPPTLSFSLSPSAHHHTPNYHNNHHINTSYGTSISTYRSSNQGSGKRTLRRFKREPTQICCSLVEVTSGRRSVRFYGGSVKRVEA
ncbi:hypothetical protein HAX54_005529 [Datura stramonium]|uniref:Uncharacterized protein n=1 Tax=Datura stramonium TaxID=4076 RepID=A0ABS8T8Z4_DATST|nr:hypothetical protein [Datura stramonium]